MKTLFQDTPPLEIIKNYYILDDTIECSELELNEICTLLDTGDSLVMDKQIGKNLFKYKLIDSVGNIYEGLVPGTGLIRNGSIRTNSRI